MLDKLFQLSERGTTVKTEILAGITTFITMAYILFLAPNILSLAGMDKDAVLIATALGGGLVTIAMGLFVNYPIALAPGVGLLAFYSFTVVLGMGVSWQTALGAVFISGLVFLVLTLTSIRQMIVEGIPASMKIAITVGIGLFISIIGLKLSGLMAISISLSPNSLGQVVQTHGNLVPPASEALLTLGNLHSGETLLALFSLIFTALLMARKIQGSLLIGVLVTTIISYATGLSTMPENFTVLAVPDFSKAAFLQLDIPGALHMGLITIIFSFTFVELFDSMGTLIGTATEAKIADPKSGKFPGLGKAMTVDAIGVSAGALLGTSTITAFVESAAGVAEGGRTGLTAVSTAFMFFLSLFLSPIFGVITSAVTASVLVIVGLFMIENIKELNLKDYTEAIPAFLTIIMMPFAYSISDGIVFGVVSYILLKLFTGRWKEISWTTVVVGIVFVLKFVFI